jgi:hypothetical protein
MCKVVLLDFVHHLNYKITVFQKLDFAFVFRLKGGRGQNGPGGLPGDPTDRYSVLPLPEDRSRLLLSEHNFII